MRKIAALIIAASLALIACSPSTPNQNIANDQNIVSRQQDIYQRTQPVPLYDFSEQRHTLLQIYSAKNEARQTWALFQSITGVPVYPYVCPSIGLPIPADTQLTNPQALVRIYVPGTNGNQGYYLEGELPQPEPDGLHSSQNTDATYVVCIRGSGKAELIYTEQKVTSVSHEVVYQNGQFIDTGKEPTITLEIRGGNGSVAPTPSPSPSK